MHRLVPLMVLCTSAAWAADPAANFALLEEFRLLDLDGDGRVSQAEAAGNAEIVTKFDRADRDHDGKLSFAEFQRLKKLKSRSARREGGSAAGGTRPPGKSR